MLQRRNTNTSLIALLKQAFESVLRSVTLTVRSEDATKQFQTFNKITKQLHNIEIELNRLRNEGLHMPETMIDMDTGTSEALEGLVKQTNELKTILKDLPEQFNSLEKTLQDKEMVVNVPEFPKVEIPKVQKVVGKVRVENQLDLQTVSKQLENIQTAIQNIKIPQPQEVKIPKFPEVKIPKTTNKLDFKEGKDLLKGVTRLEEAIKNIYIPPQEFPDAIKVSNFPPQKVPQPVTNININPLRGFVKSRAVTVGTTVTPLPGEILTNRRSLIVYNNSSVTVEIGGSTMTFGAGLPIAAGAYSPPIDAGPKMIVYGIVNTGTADVRVMEVSNESIGG